MVRVAIHAGLAGLFAAAFYDRYLRHLSCFNEHGRCYDPVTRTVYTTGGMIWGLAAAIFALLALRAVWRLRRR